MDNLEAKLEALLFLYGEPVKIKKLCNVSGADKDDVLRALNSLNIKMASGDRGLHIITSDDEVQLVTKPELKSVTKEAVKEELDTALTPASMETLSIIAYLGPCKRSTIEYIRGVNSSFILRNLMIRGLIKRHTDSNQKNTFLYSVSFDFLRHIGITSLSELPDYEKYHNFMEAFEHKNTHLNDVKKT